MIDSDRFKRMKRFHSGLIRSFIIGFINPDMPWLGVGNLVTSDLVVFPHR